MNEKEGRVRGGGGQGGGQEVRGGRIQWRGKRETQAIEGQSRRQNYGESNEFPLSPVSWEAWREPREEDRRPGPG